MRLLQATGNEVEREYYVNDAGSQIGRFADSIAARMRGTEPPEDGYAGDYVAEVAERLAADGVDPGDRETLELRGIELMLEEIRGTLGRFGVNFDNWFSERSVYAKGEVDEVARRAGEARPHLPPRRRALAADAPTSATTRTGS